MFLRRCKRRKNGKQHTYWALVEFYRTAGGSRQRVVAYLGDLKSNEESGCYLLRTNLTEVDPKTLWKRYIQLTEAEWAFRITKDELVIRPIWHHRSDRVKAHILVCFLAYVLWKSLAQWMRRAGLGDAPRTVLQEFAKIKSGDVVLPACGGNAQVSKTIRLRCVTTPDEAQKLLLNRLGLTLPQRLRRIDEVIQNVVKTFAKNPR